MTFTLRDIGIGLVIFSSVLIGMMNFMGGVFNEYSAANFDNGTLVTASSEASSQADTISEDAGDRAGQLSQGTSLLDLGGFFINTVYQIVRLPLDALNGIEAISATILGEFGFGKDAWPLTMFVGILSVVIGFEIVTLYRGVRT